MKMLDLFSGIGGISLAADWAGIETVAFCEIEPFCQKVLRKHWPDVPIFDDVTKLSKQTLTEAGVIDDERAIDIICGGYPCQPFSNAGKRAGTKDDRHLWPEMFRLIQELRPTWVVGENVAGHVSMGLGDVLSDLESEGYQTRAFLIPACAVGAIHRRDRVFVVAHSNNKHVQGSAKISIQRKQGIQRIIHTREDKEWSRRSSLFEPKLCRNLNGIPDGVDRTKALGNAVVPQQIYPIFKAIAEIERGNIAW
ncbi:DNA (cytosine-5)-methyltransferase 1 [Aneurinibacillus thermoaerophilus]|uniref:Cytosine-specific methyltransferase n=1 Tax=Aneurinibacillus thermoaerophilus TaxID=143495 RepID=A0A1G8FSL3_ANETH|nr:DNA (cytosine-5-)-methyltransferase [Aneurinibacillus thermoaerophilus]SDH85081.1 DNA (cytosine-5)-methyltransferase 1 [Aneurinibacillus thermoaerophilus]